MGDRRGRDAASAPAPGALYRPVRVRNRQYEEPPTPAASAPSPAPAPAPAGPGGGGAAENPSASGAMSPLMSGAFGPGEAKPSIPKEHVEEAREAKGKGVEFATPATSSTGAPATPSTDMPPPPRPKPKPKLKFETDI